VTVIRFQDAPVIDRGGGITSVPLVTTRSDPTAAITTGVSVYPRGTGAPLHTHNCDEQVTLLGGAGEAEIDGLVTRLGVYDTTYIRAGQRHAFRNIAEDPMTILWIYPSHHVIRTLVVSGETVEHLSDKKGRRRPLARFAIMWSRLRRLELGRSSGSARPI
jgi:quercetin dioxygenase-like cupin family protein